MEKDNKKNWLIIFLLIVIIALGSLLVYIVFSDDDVILEPETNERENNYYQNNYADEDTINDSISEKSIVGLWEWEAPSDWAIPGVSLEFKENGTFIGNIWSDGIEGIFNQISNGIYTLIPNESFDYFPAMMVTIENRELRIEDRVIIDGSNEPLILQFVR